MHIFFRFMSAVSFLITVLLSHQLLAKEPHSSGSHNYVESIYKTSSVLTLPNAIKRAIKASPRLKSVQAKLDATEGQKKQAGSWKNPELSFEAENIAGDDDFGGTRNAEYTYGLKQTIEIGGKRPARKNVAAAINKATQASVLSELLTLERDVHIAYADVLAEAEAVKLALEQEQLAKDVLNIVSKRVRAAAEPDIQQSKAEVAHATSVIAREKEERDLRIAKEKLARLWGASTLDVSLDHAHFFDLTGPELLKVYQDKFSNIPDIQRLRFLQVEKSALLELEKAQAIPDPTFNLGVRDFKAHSEQAFIFGVSLPIPILNQNSGNIAKAQAEVTQSQADAQQAQLVLEQQLVENWEQWHTSFSKIEHLEKSLLPAAEKAFKLARSGYEKGKFPYLEVLDAQRTLFSARAQYHNALKTYHASRANVERLTTSTGVSL